MEKKIRLGIIGIGNMGSGHACRVVDGECPDFVLLMMIVRMLHLNLLQVLMYGAQIQQFQDR